jgi:hypothetical protein
MIDGNEQERPGTKTTVWWFLFFSDPFGRDDEHSFLQGVIS